MSHLLLVETLILLLMACASSIQAMLLCRPRWRSASAQNLRSWRDRCLGWSRRMRQVFRAPCQNDRSQEELRRLHEAIWELNCRLTPLTDLEGDRAARGCTQELQDLVKVLSHLEDSARVQPGDVEFLQTWLSDVERRSRSLACLQQSRQDRQEVWKLLSAAQEDLSALGTRFCATGQKRFRELEGALWLLSLQNMEERVPAELCLQYARSLQQQVALFCCSYAQGLI
ncbi:hypothetical protein [Thermogemmatispora carboxidivorans]|uniref:hypothetical protein n=1 Tax=Thermogemmatispora carboxidivorans TaxID=1382306 RepID=UPI00069B6096|nr:hypothetical protein [Thermogemmatispora carboxidivorans]